MTEPSPEIQAPPRFASPKVMARGEMTFHFGLLVVAVAVITMSFLMRVKGEHLVYLPGSWIPMPESCAMKNWFGIPCPGCGLTRAFISISEGSWDRAWRFNPASFLIYAFVVCQVPWRSFQILRIWSNKPPLYSVWLFVPLGVLIMALLGQWIVRLIA